MGYPMTMDDWQDEVHTLAMQKGWWDSGPRPTAEILMNIAAEVSEAWEAYRDGNVPGQVYHTLEGTKPEGIVIELADVVIRIMDFLESEGLSLEALIAEKHEYNKTRPYRHGGKKA